MKKYTKTVLSEGKNNFKNRDFTLNEWSAPTTNDPDVIKWLISSFKLVGRKIEGFRTIGNSSYHTRQYIEDYAYKHSKITDENERKEKSKYDNIPPNIRFNRSLLLEKPFLIEFEDEQVFEVISGFSSEFRLSMDAISCIDFDENIHSNLLFYPCIGKTISSVEIKTFTTDKDPLFGEYFDEEHSKVEFVEKIILWLDDGNGISLKCGSADFFQVDYINSNNRIKKINFDKLKNGLLYWEDMHDDKQLGFKGKSSSFFFRKKGDRYVSRPRFEIYPKNKSANLICDYDFKFFLWPISIVLNNIFNGYATYEFTKEQWNNILNEAEKILNFTKFDDLFDYLINKNFFYSHKRENYFLDELNRFGVYFWNNKKEYSIQVEDLRKWSELVLLNCDSIVVQGY